MHGNQYHIPAATWSFTSFSVPSVLDWGWDSSSQHLLRISFTYNTTMHALHPPLVMITQLPLLVKLHSLSPIHSLHLFTSTMGSKGSIRIIADISNISVLISYQPAIPMPALYFVKYPGQYRLRQLLHQCANLRKLSHCHRWHHNSHRFQPCLPMWHHSSHVLQTTP